MDENKSLVNTSKLDSQTVDIANKILNEDNPESAKDLVSMFNWYMSKKNVNRILKLNNLLDGVSDQMLLRFATRADQFSNSDLIDYMKTVQSAIDNSTKALNQAEEPPKIVNHITIEGDVNTGPVFDRDSKERMLAAIQAALKSVNTPSDAVIEVTADEETSNDGNKDEEQDNQ